MPQSKSAKSKELLSALLHPAKAVNEVARLDRLAKKQSNEARTAKGYADLGWFPGTEDPDGRRAYWKTNSAYIGIPSGNQAYEQRWKMHPDGHPAHQGIDQRFHRRWAGLHDDWVEPRHDLDGLEENLEDMALHAIDLQRAAQANRLQSRKVAKDVIPRMEERLMRLPRSRQKRASRKQPKRPKKTSRPRKRSS